SSDGSISSCAAIPISLSTSGCLGCTGVLVMMCQNVVRSSTLCGSCVHGSAAVVGLPPSVIAVAAIVGSAMCVINGSAYVLGTLALIGSPLPEVARTMNCAFARLMQAGAPSANARRPLSSTVAGM